MPEIAEILRTVGRLQRHLVGRTIFRATFPEDTRSVFTWRNPAPFKEAMEGKKVMDAKQWGKYLWLVMESPPHPLMQFGTHGWMTFKNDPTTHHPYSLEPQETKWPFPGGIFNLEVKGSDDEVALIDTKWQSRVRLIDHEDGSDLRNVNPLKSHGIDPIQEKIDMDWFTKKLSKKVPLKVILSDQSIIAGLGNRLCDEILYQARIHPELQGRKLSNAQFERLRRSIEYVTRTAVEVGGDSTKFPDHWLMRHDWNRRIKHQKLPNGEPVVFYKVGSRASAYVPIVQVKSRIEKDDDNRKTKPTTELLFEMENPPKSKPVVEPPPKDVLVVRDDGSCEFEEEEAQKLLPGERPQTAGSVYSPPPTRQNPGRSKRR